MAKLRGMIEMADEVRIDDKNGTINDNVEDLSIHLDYGIMLSENFSDAFCKRVISLKLIVQEVSNKKQNFVNELQRQNDILYQELIMKN